MPHDSSFRLYLWKRYFGVEFLNIEKVQAEEESFACSLLSSPKILSFLQKVSVLLKPWASLHFDAQSSRPCLRLVAFWEMRPCCLLYSLEHRCSCPVFQGNQSQRLWDPSGSNGEAQPSVDSSSNALREGKVWEPFPNFGTFPNFGKICQTYN